MLFSVKENSTIFIANETEFKDLTKEQVRKTIVKNSIAFQRDKMVIDPFSLKNDAMNELSEGSEYLIDLISRGFYGFRKGSTDTVLLIDCKDIKII